MNVDGPVAFVLGILIGILGLKMIGMLFDILELMVVGKEKYKK